MRLAGGREDTEAARVCTLRRPLAALGALASLALSAGGRQKQNHT